MCFSYSLNKHAGGQDVIDYHGIEMKPVDTVHTGNTYPNSR